MAQQSKKTNVEKTINVNGKQKQVFVLREDKNVVYIPYSSLMRPDFHLLRKNAEIAQRKGEDLLDTLRDQTAQNGRNALVQVQNLIRYVDRNEAYAYTTPSGKTVQMSESASKEDFSNPVASPVESEPEQTTQQEAPKKRGPGRPPKN